MRNALNSVVALLALGLGVSFAVSEEGTEANAQTLKAAGAPTDVRTLADEDDRRLKELVRQLGSHNFREREQAAKDLLTQGMSAVPFLRDAVKDKDLQISRRAARIIKA